MDNLKKLKNEEIINLIKNNKITIADIIDSGICPTCLDKQNNNILYGDNTNRVIFEDDKFECILVPTPRAVGHTIISTKKHYKDMMVLDDTTCKDIFILSKKSNECFKRSI